MPLPGRGQLRPWVEALILSYGAEQSSSQRLKARVVRVEQMSPSQAEDSGGPTGLLLLSDGVLLVPAVLTAAAWERLQEQEDRDSLDGLVNSTVVLQHHQLRFHMSPEQTKCRFFLSVAELAVTSAGPPGCSTPCCTTLASVRRKICQTWKGLLEQKVEESQGSQSGFDLSMLLGEWQQDCMLGVLKDVEDRLMELASPQPSTLKPPHPGHQATSWDVDRLRFRAETSFSVPVRCLLIPDVVQLQAAGNVSVDATGPSPVHQAEADQPAAAGTELHLPASEDHMTGGVIDGPLSNPWDVFAALGDSLCPTQASGAETATQVCHSPAASTHLAHSSSTQLPLERSSLPPYQQVELHASAGPSTAGPSTSGPSTSGPSTAGPSTSGPSTSRPSTAGPSTAGPSTSGPSTSRPSTSRPSTSRPSTAGPSTSRPSTAGPSTSRPSTSRPSTAGPSTSGPSTSRPSTSRPSTAGPSTTRPSTSAGTAEGWCAQLQRPASEDPGETTAKRRRGRPGAEAGDEDAGASRSPPSWLFDSQAEGGAPAQQQQRRQQSALRRPPSVHSDGRAFSYSYQVSGQNLQDLSRLTVRPAWLQWAVRYLLGPEQDPEPASEQACRGCT